MSSAEGNRDAEVGRRRQTIKDAWQIALTRAKIDGLHFHDLRREAGSRWTDANVPLATIQRWLGHTNIAQTSTYLGASLDELDMQTYEQRIGRIAPSPMQAPPDSSRSADNAPKTRATLPERVADLQCARETCDALGNLRCSRALAFSSFRPADNTRSTTADDTRCRQTWS